MTETRHGVEVDDELLDKMTELMDERRNWRGYDWPRPNPGENPKKVAVCGFANSRLICPFGADGWEFWGLNDPGTGPGMPARHAFTRWFQIHPPHYLAKHYPKGLKDLAEHWGTATGLRLYMDRHYDEYPDSEPYPKDGVESEFQFGKFHASSFDWMMALAIYEGFEEINIFGCDFYNFPITNGEPIAALGCMQYWMGVAVGRGIKVELWGGGHMMTVLHLAAYQSGLQYGFEREPALDLHTDEDPAWRDLR